MDYANWRANRLSTYQRAYNTWFWGKRIEYAPTPPDLSMEAYEAEKEEWLGSYNRH